MLVPRLSSFLLFAVALVGAAHAGAQEAPRVSYDSVTKRVVLVPFSGAFPLGAAEPLPRIGRRPRGPVAVGRAAASDATPAQSVPTPVPTLVPATSVGRAEAAPMQATTGAGRLTGRVIDRETGRALQGVQVSLVGTRLGSVTDLDGRYDVSRIPVGTYGIVARLIGYRPQRQDSVRIAAGATLQLNFALGTAPSVLQGVTVTAEAPRQSDTDVGLLAMQKNAASASDGISAAAMSRTPASNAAEAIVKVPGVSVVGNKFVIVRGMADRYNSTTLNGAELASPEPARRIVPMDIFPSSLLESIITVKSATPDKPGDFSGGLVEVKTREFPDQFSAQLSITTESHDLTTGLAGHYPSRSGSDLFGFGDRRRQLDPVPVPVEGGEYDRFLQRNFAREVLPALTRAPLNGSLSGTLGGKWDSPVGLVGLVASGTFGSEVRRTPEREFTFRQGGSSGIFKANVSDEWQSTADVNGLVNLSYRPLSWTKLGWKSLYTRNAEDLALRSVGINEERTSLNLLSFQRRYIVRELMQSQLSGEHTLGVLRDARFEWRATWSEARRLEPENNQALYSKSFDESVYRYSFFLLPSFQDRRLFDGSGTVQGDLVLPFSLWRNDDAQIKIGGLVRNKRRVFDATLMYYFQTQNPFGSPVAFPQFPQFELGPNEFYQPENLGFGTSLFHLRPISDVAFPYRARERVGAGYAMVDVPLRPWLRVVGGARYEDWRLSLTYASGTQLETTIPAAAIDVLPSANVTVRLGSKANLRLAYFEAVTRPDARELSPDLYTAITAECTQRGNPALRRTRTRNADARWEYFPDLGELLSFSVFYKRFDGPIVETFTFQSVDCVLSPVNAQFAENLGAELEIRRRIGRAWNAALNVTAVQAVVQFDPATFVGGPRYPFAGQSPILTNLVFGYEPPGGALQASVAANYFSDRALRYGGRVDGDVFRSSNVYEVGRTTVDAKVSRRFGRSVVSLAGRNLFGARIAFQQEVPDVGFLSAGGQPIGRSLSFKVAHDF